MAAAPAVMLAKGCLLIVGFVLAQIAVAQQSNQDEWVDDWQEEAAGSWTWSGFVEAGLGNRVQNKSARTNDTTLAELRWRSETQRNLGRTWFALKADASYDEVSDSLEGDLRELTLSFSPGQRVDMKVGRQVLTWGTGDFLFLNDLFPKDFQAFFSGREDEYLKTGSDAIRFNWYGDLFNLDLAWMPEFEPDRYLTGERFSFFSPTAGDIVAPNPPAIIAAPDRFPQDGELAVRIYRIVGGAEFAAYGYSGFFKQPSARDDTGMMFFAELDALGASLRRPLGSGLIHSEVAYYHSKQDRAGSRSGIPNSQFRLLAGYERELFPHFTAAVQAYLERTLDYGAMIRNSPFPQFEPDKNRTVVTIRATWRAWQDKLTVSLFAFASPSDRDYHLRPRIDYRYDDQWSFSLGGNLFGGDNDHTFFGQLDNNDNLYLRVRWHY